MVRKIRAKLVLQLRAEGLSGRVIAASQGMSRKSITAVLEAADAAGLGPGAPGDGPGRGDAEVAAWRVRRFTRRCRRAGDGL